MTDLGYARRKRGPRTSWVQGILAVDKPVGITSHDVVQKVRRIYGLRQVGHTGTLDPIASGVLVLLVGSATRIAQYLQKDDKEYHLTLRLGLETDTQDITGDVVREGDPTGVTREAVVAAARKYEGTFSQVPPSFSAVKRSGRPLYRLARQGVRIQAEPREVTIYSIDITDWDPPRASLEVVCSKGTYMRTLCHDVGRDLGTGGCMESLVRVRSGIFSLGDTVDLARLEADPTPEDYLRDAATGLSFPVSEPADDDLLRLISGTPIPWGGDPDSGIVSVARRGRLIALARAVETGGERVLTPLRILEPNLKELFKQKDK